jgi:vacuolar-type H+-ATPase subunit F/Vma7
MDNAFYAEDLTAFQEALERVRLLYTEALFKCGRTAAVKVWSEILRTYLWVVADEKDIETLRSQGITETIYTAEEIKKLKGLSKDSLMAIHRVKETFKESKVEDIRFNKGDNPTPFKVIIPDNLVLLRGA